MAKTKIDAGKFVDVLVRLGVHAEEQKNFVKCGIEGSGRFLYVEKRKDGWVTRVDLSGFEMPVERGIKDLPEDKWFSSVKQQLDFSLSEEEILATFESALLFAASLDPRPATRGGWGKKSAAAPRAWGGFLKGQPVASPADAE